jgi:hypothetical protein
MPSKQHWYLLNRRLHGLQSQSGHLGEEINLLPLLGFVPYTIQPVAYSVYRLSYSGSHTSKYIDEISLGFSEQCQRSETVTVSLNHLGHSGMMLYFTPF